MMHKILYKFFLIMFLFFSIHAMDEDQEMKDYLQDINWDLPDNSAKDYLIFDLKKILHSQKGLTEKERQKMYHDITNLFKNYLEYSNKDVLEYWQSNLHKNVDTLTALDYLICFFKKDFPCPVDFIEIKKIAKRYTQKLIGEEKRKDIRKKS